MTTILLATVLMLHTINSFFAQRHIVQIFHIAALLEMLIDIKNVQILSWLIGAMFCPSDASANQCQNVSKLGKEFFIVDALRNSPQSVSSHSVTTVDGFIAETQDTLSFILRNQNEAIGWKASFPSKLYNLTEIIHVQHRSITLIGFCFESTVLTICRKPYLQISSSGGMNSFLIAVDGSAYILNLHTEPNLSGTDAMLLIHSILSRLGVKQCKLENTAKVRYQFRAKPDESERQAFIPMICLRCIKGELSDWFANFGYSNENQWQIAEEMQKVHNIPLDTSSRGSFGPWLLSLWNQADKAEFHKVYENSKSRFSKLLRLRDDRNSPWTAHID